MPELPEAQTIADDLDNLISGTEIKNICVIEPSIVDSISIPFEEIIGSKVFHVSRWGKMILIKLDHGLNILASLRMTGHFILNPYPEDDIFPDHVRLAISLGGDNLREPSGLFYRDIRKFGRIFFLTDELFSDFKEKKVLGVDALEITADIIFNITRDRKTSIKSFLMNQKLVSGLGNIYANECLFNARIKPKRLVSSLSLKECQDLETSIKETMIDAIKLRGSTIRDYFSPRGP
jgi:formamidopyrimidine-DNA glycosylase